MKREDQIKLIESISDRLDEVADRIMSEPLIRRTITKRADEKYSQEYQASTVQLRYG